MLVPENESAIKKIKIPGFLFRSLGIVAALFLLFFGILAYDYWKIIQQIQENKHLYLENKQLREQLQLFQMKLNGLDQDIERIGLFEKKLRVLIGVEDATKMPPLKGPREGGQMMDDNGFVPKKKTLKKKQTKVSPSRKEDSDQEFSQLKQLYQNKLEQQLKLDQKLRLTQKWSELIRSSFELPEKYARFDQNQARLAKESKSLESRILFFR